MTHENWEDEERECGTLPEGYDQPTMCTQML